MTSDVDLGTVVATVAVLGLAFLVLLLGVGDDRDRRRGTIVVAVIGGAAILWLTGGEPHG